MSKVNVGMRSPAKVLKRIREIESDYIAQHGEFDWEKLPENLQDEYDRLCILLDELSGDEEYVEWNISEQNIESL